LGPIPNTQSPNPKPQSPLKKKYKFIYILNKIFKKKFIIKKKKLITNKTN